jgi:hypothetical protein
VGKQAPGGPNHIVMVLSEESMVIELTALHRSGRAHVTLWANSPWNE